MEKGANSDVLARSAILPGIGHHRIPFSVPKKGKLRLQLVEKDV